LELDGKQKARKLKEKAAMIPEMGAGVEKHRHSSVIPSGVPSSVFG
jgi:hypothetical protein